jgi:hypothetical protein
MSNNVKKSDEYFATLTNPIELADQMTQKVTEWRSFCRSKGLIDLWKRKLTNYYGISGNGNSSQQVIQGGAEGELQLIKVNDMQSLLQEQLVLVTSQRPAGQAKAVNTDSASLRSSRIGTALSEYYMANVGWEAKFVQATETALVCDEAFTEIFWDKKAGDPIAIDPTNNQPEMSGDATLRIHAPWNVARDPGAPTAQQHWFIVSYLANRFDLAAAYPKFAREILDAAGDNLPELPMCKIPSGSDMIYVHQLIHDRTAAVPMGRYSLMVGDQIVLDTELPYKDFPIERITPKEVIDGPTGYTQANDIMGLEQITDALHSVITTNNVTFGCQNIVVPIGSGLNIPDFGKGLRVFEVQADMVDKITPLQMTRTAPETFSYIDKLESKKQQQTGSASGVLAAQATQGASGAAMALVDAKSIQYNSGLQRSYYRLLSSMMTKLIGVLRTYADTPRVARIVGKQKQAGLKEFKYTGQDLNSISSIVYELVNPISQTQGGRLTMGQDLIKSGLIKSPKQYISVVTTGNLETLTQDDEADQLLILEENELLTEGKPIKAILTEMHPDHIKSHMSVLSSAKAKEDPALVQNTLAHILDHIQVWTQASMEFPGLLAALNIPPIPLGPQAMGPGPGMPPGAPPEAGGMVGGGDPSMGAEMPEPAGLPTNPSTGETAEVPGATPAL